MKTTAIISEFNPFHKGHQYLVEQVKKIVPNCHIMSIMSGNFVQRGGPAILPKHIRARHAIESGIDLVIELPFVFAHSTAELFARGAVLHLNQCEVDYLAFGCENADITLLTDIAELLIKPTALFKKTLQQHLKSGDSFALSRAYAVCAELGDAAFAVLNQSNNILAIEYIKQLILTDSKIVPLPILRIGSKYNDEEISQFSFSSATAIRKAVFDNQFDTVSLEVSKHTSHDLETYFSAHSYQNGLADLSQFLKIFVVREGKTPISNTPDVSEGLENRIFESIQNNHSIDEMINSIKTKRYTESRIRRILYNLLIGYTKDVFDIMRKNSINPYIHILASNKNGFKKIKNLKSSEQLAIVNNLNELNNKTLTSEQTVIRDIEIKCTEIFNYLLPSEHRKHEFQCSPIILD